jgi:hypothetical protein
MASLSESFANLSEKTSALEGGLSESATALSDSVLAKVDTALPRLTMSATRFVEALRVKAGGTATALPVSFFVPPDLLDKAIGIQGRLVEITAQIERFAALTEEVTETLETQRNDLVADGEAAVEAVEEWQTACDDELDEAIAAITDVSDDLETVEQQLVDTSELLETGIENSLVEAPTEFIGQMDESAKELLTHLEDTLRASAEHLSAAVSEAAGRLTDDIGNRISEQLEGRIRVVLEDALKELANDAVSNTLLTQLGISLTTTLSPVLPQLIVVKVTLSSLKDALQAVRALG